MKHPIILSGQEADWDLHSLAQEHVANDEGEVNWGAAMLADPGVMRCPKCELWLWHEGDIVECPDCAFVWSVHMFDAVDTAARRALSQLVGQPMQRDVLLAALDGTIAGLAVKQGAAISVEERASIARQALFAAGVTSG